MEEANLLLEQLHDIDLPGNSGLPIAPGWILVALICLGLILYVFKRLRRKPDEPVVDLNWQSPALSELDQICARLDAGDTASVLAECSRLARRITIAMTRRSDVAGLTGQSWLQKLDDLSATDFFTKGSGRLLESAPYQKTAVTDQRQLQQIVEALRQLIDSGQGVQA